MNLIKIIKKNSLIFPAIFFFALLFPLSVSATDNWTLTEDMNHERLWHTASLLHNGNVLIVGGIFAGPTAEIYNPTTNKWTLTPSLNSDRWWHTATTLNDGKVLVAGGNSRTSQQNITNSTEIYDPESKSWETVDNLNIARQSHHAVLLPDGKVLIAGGRTINGITNTAEIYNPNEKSWTLIENMNEPRCCASVNLLNRNNVLISGGQTTRTEIYNTETGKWSYGPSLRSPHGRHTSTKLIDGGILVVGGAPNWPDSTTLSEIYIPNLDIWNKVDTLNTARAYHAASLLENGRVLISGGATSYEDPQITSELYDPDTEKWSYTSSMNHPRLGHTSTTLANNQVLITGGVIGSSHFDQTATSEIYTPDDSSINYLQVPLFKQNDPVWGDEIYDFAEKWNPSSPYIKNWGCTLTSAAMVLKYHGYDLLPDGSKLNPSTLNTWLKKQPDGFTRNGLVNWDPLKRLSLQAKNINNVEFGALDFFRINSNSHDDLKTHIENEDPVILEVNHSQTSTHFVVATGFNDNTFKINDPGADYETLDSYSNSFNSMRLFKPTSTDLSAIKLVTNDNVNIEVKYKNQSIGNALTQKPLGNDRGDGTSGDPLNYFYIEDPDSGVYEVSLSTDKPQKFDIDVYLYDKDANVKIKTYKGFLFNNSNNEVYINFNKLNVNESKINRKRALGKDKK